MASVLAASIAIAPAQLMSVSGKFDVSATGAATYSIPIAVPPGTAGMAPALTLEYNSQAGNGIVGIGWSLGGLPTITRCPRTMTQDGAVGAISYDANDRFCMDGHRLVAISGSYGADGTEYRTEIDSFNRVISHGAAGTGPAWFEVHTKAGQTMQFGDTTDSRPLNAAGTARSWLVNKISDSKGNYLTASYTNDSTNGQIYPTRIDYTGNAAAGLATYNSVQFVYATRPDIVPVYHAGAITKTTVRLTDVKTFSGSTLVSDYQLTYVQQYSWGPSTLSSVKRCASDGTCLAGPTFNWTANNPTSFAFNSNTQTVVKFGTPPTSTWSPIGGDFNGDGKSDIALITSSGSDSFNTTIESYLSNGDGTFNHVEQILSTPKLGYPPTATNALVVGDFNGDGKTDFALVGKSTIDTFLSNGDGTFTQVQQTVSLNTISTYWLIVGDLDVDGRTDFALVSQSSLHSVPSTVTKFTSAGNGRFVQSSFSLGTNYASTLLFSSGDFNGDGAVDFVLVQTGNDSGSINAWLNNRDGTFTSVTQTTAALPTYSTMLAGDFNNDGKGDLVLVNRTTANVYLSKGDGTFAASSQTLTTNFGNPPTAAWTPISGDFNGDGKTDFAFVQGSSNPQGIVFDALISNGDGTFTQSTSHLSGPNVGIPPTTSWTPFSGDFKGAGSGSFAFLSGTTLNTQLNTNVTPYLLSSISDALGGGENLTYAPLTQSTVYTKDTNATYPVQDMIGPMYVVSRVDASNGIEGSYSTTYTYAGGKGDLSGRGFLGFRQTTQQDLQTNIVKTTNFNQGFPYIGTVNSGTKTLGSQTLNQSTNTLQFSNASGGTTVSTPSLTSAPYQVSVAQTVEASNDLDGSSIPTVTSTFQYDAYGNPTQIVVSTPDGFSKTTTNTYTNDTVNWFLGRLTNATITSTTP